MSKKRFSGLRLILMVPVVVLLAGGLIIGGRALQEPGEVRTLKKQEVAQTDIRSIISAFLMRMNREATARSWRGSEALRINFICLSQEIMR
jgi:phosphotransferase system  glucose/maltose/N-acetylglucosamine-specific IIC component